MQPRYPIPESAMIPVLQSQLAAARAALAKQDAESAKLREAIVYLARETDSMSAF